MFHSSSARWLAAFPATAAIVCLATLGAVAAVAQPASTNSRAATASTPPALTYNSALEGYQPFADEKPISWKEANETVYRRGGWQAYAKEASETGATAGDSPKGAAAAPAAQPGHSMPMQMPMPAKKEKP